MKGRLLLLVILACVVVVLVIVTHYQVNIHEDGVMTYMVPVPGHVSDNTPLGELRRQGEIILPNIDAMSNMSATAAHLTYHSYLDNIDTKCSRKLRMGNLGDGGWEICDDRTYRPVKPCIVYSFGINHDFSFDDDTARNYECDVFSFDPSMKTNSYQRSERVRFLNIGIGGENTVNEQNWEMHTLGRLKDMLNHTEKVIDVLKMDVERGEWPSLPEMLASQSLSSVRQLLVEYHGQCTDRDQCIRRLKVLKDVQDLGFRKFYVHKNPVCQIEPTVFPVVRTQCYEVHYVNTRLEVQ
ncbi:probable methyltransferase-like protein 24 [Haliotis asinina]|uniref:probable methyltransferase-like protein 24 n=1 Tax=Haliotis asinina TaxID=109174 RepID=UPI003531FF9F